MRRGAYSPYRGRGGAHKFLKILVAVLAVLLILSIGLWFLMDRFLVASSDGYRLNLPFLSGERKPQNTPEPTGGLPLTVEPSGSPAPAGSAGEQGLRAVFLPASALFDGTAAQQVAAAGGDAAVFDMKADNGTLGYYSQLPLAKKAEASTVAASANETIRAFNADGGYTIARVSCFRDNKGPYFDNTAALRGGGGNWRDAAGSRWLNPGREEACAYVVGVCTELAELGFDEILLDYAGYPTEGKLNSIQRGKNYNPQDLTGPVAAFYAQVAQALKPYPQVKLSIVTSPAVLRGEADESGQTLDLLKEYAGRVWVEVPAGQALPETPDGVELVVLTDAVTEQMHAWALMKP